MMPSAEKTPSRSPQGQLVTEEETVGGACAPSAGGMAVRKTGAAFAYRSKGHVTDPSGAGVALAPLGAGGRGCLWKENAARGKARTVPVHGAAEMAGDALA
ncbi:MAG: hypothetical protein KKH02_05875 [Proteobacteria bacterium]|nr:hypothetical protein [Pseudomonadota bacterium]MCG2740590.1 hypothetical protein [Syntrophaceae bacterium]